MFFKKASLILLLLLGILSFSPSVKAENDQLLFGQNHYYSAFFRGNGEAIVYARLIISNGEESKLSEVSFQPPVDNIYEVSIFQQKLPKHCPGVYYGARDDKDCGELVEPDYNYTYSYWNEGEAKYTKTKYAKDGNVFKITLPEPIEPYKSGAVIMSFVTKDFVVKKLGVNRFEFQTLKSPVRINTVRVTVDIDSDLILKGQRSEVNYNEGQRVGDLVTSSKVSETSPQLDNISRYIGYYGLMTKETKSLAPGETFIVKGEYSDSWFKLYWNRILLSVVILVVIIGAVYLLSRLANRGNKGGGLQSEEAANTVSVRAKNAYLITITLALGSVILAFLLTYLVNLAGGFFHPYYDPVLEVALMIAMLLLYVLVILGPGIFIAAKNGWRIFLVFIASEVIWFILAVILYRALFANGIDLPNAIMY